MIQITEDKIRQITLETQRALGSGSHPDMVRKVVRAVVDRLLQKAAPESGSDAR